MVVYNFNQGIGWASSGVEYAQSYRGKIFRKLGVDARFIFTDMIRGDNIQELTQNLHFEDREVIWMYQFFTDFPIAPCSLTEEQVTASFPEGPWKINDIGGGRKQYVHEEQKLFITVYFSRMYPDKVSRVEYVAGGCLLRTDKRSSSSRA
ncbi:MAG: accessory Sec system glycosyltransferase GtfA, partial [Lachnospiraceae bacterium]|nr:accessory Sec system glycosyltransferase GtfA [Lachnospiraceae bacterium]